uniref:Secreted protein n=1 Tax=Caenorhabditis japonica TaxID=281687 RepID=A0A8R1ERE8_CAEJA
MKFLALFAILATSVLAQQFAPNTEVINEFLTKYANTQAEQTTAFKYMLQLSLDARENSTLCATYARSNYNTLERIYKAVEKCSCKGSDDNNSNSLILLVKNIFPMFDDLRTINNQLKAQINFQKTIGGNCGG